MFRYGVAGLCALLGGQFLYSLFWYGFQQGEYYDTLPMVVCLLAAGAIGYYGASMLLAKAFKVFRGSWKGLGIVLAGCALVCCVLHFDLLGVADRVPEAGEGRGPAGAGQGPPSNGGCRRILCSGDGGPQIFHLV